LATRRWKPAAVNVRVRGQEKAEGSVKAEAFMERVKGLIESKAAKL